MTTQNSKPPRPDTTNVPKPVTDYIFYLEDALERTSKDLHRYKLLGQAVCIYVKDTLFHGQSDKDCEADGDALATFFWQ